MNLSMPPQDCLLLPPAMTIETIESVAAEYKQFPLHEKLQLRVDASQLETISTPGIQLLLSLEKSVSMAGGHMVIENCAASVRPSFATLGVLHLLAAPVSL